MRNNRQLWLRIAAVGIAGGALIGCGGPVVTKPTPIVEAIARADAEPAAYRLGPGDQIDLRFFYNPELDTQLVVRPDGRISAPLVDDLWVAGRTVPEVNADLREVYAKELRRPEVTVIVRFFAANRYFVSGEVNTPGAFESPGGLTVLQSIAQAGGMKDTARSDEIAIVRRDATGEPYVVPVDLDRLISGEDTSQDLRLQPQDVVFVPKSDIAEVNKFVDQYIRKNIPVGVGVGVPLGGS